LNLIHLELLLIFPLKYILFDFDQLYHEQLYLKNSMDEDPDSDSVESYLKRLENEPFPEHVKKKIKYFV